MVDKNVPASPFAPDKNPCIVLRYGKETGGILLNPSGSNGLHDIKIRNIIRIREMIFRNYPICRVDLAETLGVTLPTVTTNIKSKNSRKGGLCAANSYAIKKSAVSAR